MEERYTNYDRQPAHLFRPGATYFITGKTLQGEPILATGSRREEFLDSLEFACRQRGWQRVAWVALPNHYHCILKAPEDSAASLSGLVGAVHSYTSRRWNREDGTPGRQSWNQFWDVCLDSLGSFWARINYIHYNPVRHGYVSDPAEYLWSSCREWQRYGDTLSEIELAYPWDRLDLE
jgi:putative transposase